MANAWCINAIWYDWCFIQTLQNLDSACIWVWVQFTAPNPLDDKRFDYIKYTDKCWNTCCLTWENEILIYATQWTLKNLTLTNDDTNEVVNVKRTDVFWSNWKKTVVRYKTWWYPTSITDWTLAVEELVQNQYSSSWYNVSWLSDATTYYFSVFAVAQDDTIIVVQTKNITTDFVFAWYQQVEYIQSSWTNSTSWQYINTWIIPTPANTTVKLRTTPTSSSYSVYLCAVLTADNNWYYYWLSFTANRRHCWRWTNWWSWQWYPIVDFSYSRNRWSWIYDVEYRNDDFYIDDTLKADATANTTSFTYPMYLFARNNHWTVWSCSSFRLYQCQISQAWTLVRDFRPVYRKSDNVIWLLDIVNKVFYTNQWTWSFTKWPNV